MVYVDACVIVAVITIEPRSAEWSAWINAQPCGTLFTSGWVDVEILSALSIKTRARAITPDDRARHAAAWGVDMSPAFIDCPIALEHFEAAARYCEQHDLGLRAGDALHLAIARGYGLQLATLDTVLAVAAAQLGLGVVEV